MGAVLHEILVDVGTGISLIGIANDVFHHASGFPAGLPFEVQGKARATAPAQAGVLEFALEPVAVFAQQVPEWLIVGVQPRKGRRQLSRLKMGHDGVAVFRIALPGLEKISEGLWRLAGVVTSFKLQGIAFMTTTEAADVAYFLWLEMGAQLVVELFLGARTETRGSVANKDFFARVFLLQKVVKGNRPQSHGIPEKRFLSQFVYDLRFLRSTICLRCLNHAFEKVFFSALAEGEGA